MYGCFARCLDFLEDLEVSLAIDNHGMVTNDGDLLYSLLSRLNHPRLGANLDTMNYRWYGHEVATCNRFYELMAPRTLHVHLKDGTGIRRDYRGAALGEGEIDLGHALKCLKTAGYHGVYCAEYEGPERENGVGYARCLDWMKANLD